MRNHPRRTYREPLCSRDFAAAENAASARAPAPAKNARGRTPNGNIFFFFLKDGRGRSRAALRAMRLTSPPVDFDFASHFRRRAVRRPPAAFPPDFDPTSDSRFRRADRAAFALDPHPHRDAKPQQEKKKEPLGGSAAAAAFFCWSLRVGRCRWQQRGGREGRRQGKKRRRDDTEPHRLPVRRAQVYRDEDPGLSGTRAAVKGFEPRVRSRVAPRGRQQARARARARRGGTGRERRAREAVSGRAAGEAGEAGA